jgi:hypothetical protein
MTMRAAMAALLYFACVFAAGFLLGPFRVLWIEPRLGPFLATLAEAPFLIAAMVLAARHVAGRTAPPLAAGERLAVGVLAAALVLVSDATVGRWMRGLSLNDQIAGLASPAGLAYLAMIGLFAAMPRLVQAR